MDEDTVAERAKKVRFYERYDGQSPWITFKGVIPEGGFQQVLFPGATIDKHIMEGKLDFNAIERTLSVFRQTVETIGRAHGDIVRPNDPRIPEQFRGRNAHLGHIIPNNVLVDGQGESQRITIIDWSNPSFLWKKGINNPEFISLEDKTLEAGLRKFA